MNLSLDSNPFAILRLATTATREEVVEAADRVGGEAAMLARRALFVPRQRLDAEIAFLPGLGSRARTILDLANAGDLRALNKVPSSDRHIGDRHVLAAPIGKSGARFV
jgi:hypothetical protein